MIDFAIMLLDIGPYVLDTWFYLVVSWIGVCGVGGYQYQADLADLNE